MYTKAFLLHLIKAWEITLKKKRDEEIGEHQLNGKEIKSVNPKGNQP